MMLPLVDEIREARAWAQQCTEAARDLARVRALLTNMEQHPGGLFDDGVVDELADRWPDLADLHAADAPPGADQGARALARRMQLEAAAQALTPRAAASEAAAHRMADLQKEQQAQLKDPRYATVVAEVRQWQHERHNLAAALQPKRARLAKLVAAKKVASQYCDRTRVSSAEAEHDDDPIAAWKTALLCHTLATSLDTTLQALDVMVTVADAPTPVPPRPVDIDVGAMRDLIRGATAALRSTRQTLLDEHAVLDNEVAELDAKLATVTTKVLDRLG